MSSIVALDLETTGLDPNKDTIIEIGAVRFSERRIEHEWHSLINPGRRIPPVITQLTGITDAMVRNAPPISAVIDDLVDFIGNDPVLGHNIKFDLSFLNKYNVLGFNDRLDTYEMAAVLMPSASSYKLGAIAQSLGIILHATHRALDDARVTHAVYLQLLRNAQSLPLDLLAEIVRLSENFEDWAGYGLFFEALRTRSRETVQSRRVKKGYHGPIFDPPPDSHISSISTPSQPILFDMDNVGEILEYGGEYSRFFPNYEHRPQQIQMAHAVSQSLSEGQHLLVEAGTGVGKSLAYLTPAAIWATNHNTRVVISTNTINLQDQLVNKDIPDLKNALGIDVRASVLKGRSNYICPRRLEFLRRRGPENAEEMRILGKVLVWLLENQTGDRGEISLNRAAERGIWNRISAADDGCTTETCLNQKNGICPFFRARQSAHNAHLVIVNHALLLADIATGNRVLPDYDFLIVDEAHHLEGATTNALSFRFSQLDAVRLFRELGSQRSGILGRLLNLITGKFSPQIIGAVNHLIQKATDQAFQIESLIRAFLTTLDHFLIEQRDGRAIGQYSQRARILPATRTQPSWTEVEISWEDCQTIVLALISTLEKLGNSLGEILNETLEENDLITDVYNNLSNIFRRIKDLNLHIENFVFKPDGDMIYWAEIQPDGRKLSLQAAPLHIGTLMEKNIWYEKESVILTSATLKTTGEFDYIRSRLNAEDADELSLGSPFDFENAVLLYIADNIPEPSDHHGHQRAVERGIVDLCRVTGGRTLVLFTSYAQLKRTSRAITRMLKKDDIFIFEQGGGASPHALLENFRSTEKAILLGTRAFWEGIDIPGEALSVLVIVKLPFDVPSDPIVAARAETFEDPFTQYSLPEAILRFRQGFGRLIRTQEDRGVVVILDRRVLTKRYGPFFLDSLPPCTRRVGSIQNLPREAARWLNI